MFVERPLAHPRENVRQEIIRKLERNTNRGDLILSEDTILKTNLSEDLFSYD